MYQLLHSLFLMRLISFILRTQVNYEDCQQAFKSNHIQNGFFITIAFTHLLGRLVSFGIIVFIPINFQPVSEIKCSIQRNLKLFHLGIITQCIILIISSISIWFLKNEPEILWLSFLNTQIPRVSGLL